MARIPQLIVFHMILPVAGTCNTNENDPLRPFGPRPAENGTISEIWLTFK